MHVQCRILFECSHSVLIYNSIIWSVHDARSTDNLHILQTYDIYSTWIPIHINATTFACASSGALVRLHQPMLAFIPINCEQRPAPQQCNSKSERHLTVGDSDSMQRAFYLSIKKRFVSDSTVFFSVNTFNKTIIFLVSLQFESTIQITWIQVYPYYNSISSFKPELIEARS